ncbi:hypothetical protein INS49_012603 [Diaporthe citri]|uniref:uncharacterized protein n=1 Tax=Diaporthe citri TaxID=83186 RepID=UPI001C7FF6FD|nr:uncharacterized protein INS49_012603 [Diaporthe citri]KAG6359083.1 hypothetical protein INS49_012603 [Diaporthe citri]
MGKASRVRPTVHFIIPYTTLAETKSTIMTASAGNHILQVRVLLLIQAILYLLFSLVAADCYWPDGSNAYDMQECYGLCGADGLCCAPGDLCLVNHLCQRNGPDHALYRGACNMPNWTEAATCPKVCVSEKDGNNVTGIQIVENCFDEPFFFACDTTGLGNACVAWHDPVFSVSGCAREYNTAGNPIPVTAMPSCSGGSDPLLTSSTTFDIGPASTFTDYAVPTGSPSSFIRE